MSSLVARLRDPDGRLFALARSGTRMTRWWLIPILLLFFVLAGAGGEYFPLESAEEAGLWTSALDTTGFLIVGYLPIALVVGLWVWRWEKRGPRTFGLRRGGALRYWLAGFGLGTGLMTLGVVLLATSGSTTVEFDQSSVLGWVAIGPALVVLVGWVAQGFTEELVFRGWMLQNTGAQLGPLAGVTVANIIFALAHLSNPGITPLGATNLVLIGVLFTLIAIVEGGIWAVTGLHIAWNWTQSNLYGFKVSGLDVGGGSLIKVIPDESAGAITGGDFGFEGSIAATITIIIGLVVVLAVASRKEFVVGSS